MSERKVYVVLGAGSLGYARHCFGSLLERSTERVDLRLITDGAEDVRRIEDCMVQVNGQSRHRWEVIGKQQTDERAAEFYRGRAELLAFRNGHPCWRKLTDPVMYASEGQECVLLDPDLYFPNAFAFEETPARGILLMWQKPNCLYPPASVEAAFAAGIQLADHVDIGVAHVRGGMDWEWMDWLLGKMGGWRGGQGGLPRQMHIEAILWSALAMRMGGGYLDPSYWLCWRGTPWKNLLMRAKASGAAMMKRERLDGVKCFHGGGPAKYWIDDAARAGILPGGGAVAQRGRVSGFVEFKREEFTRQQRMKRMLRRLGYYRLTGG